MPRPTTLVARKITTMIADCAFAIGATHAVCQDYARARTTETGASVWLADGCSGSPDTDCGARLLVQIAQQQEPTLTTAGTGFETWAEQIARYGARVVRLLHLVPEALDATLLGIVADREKETFQVVVYGDGIAVLGRTDGILETYHVSYARNFPQYLNYRNVPDRARQWEHVEGNTCRIATRNAPDVPARAPFVLERRLSDYRFAMVFSDGLETFTRPDDSGPQRSDCDWRDVLGELTAIKSWRGEWARRRFQRFLRDRSRDGWQHADDLSMAGVYFGE